MSAPASIRSATGLFSGVVLLTALVVALSADGALSGNRGGFSPEIYVMNADGSGQANLTRNRAADDAPAWSRDGAKIALSSERDGNWEIYVMQADGTGPTRLTVNRSADDAFPDWSPDGTKIAFHTDRDGNYEIYVMNADGSGQANLTHEARTDDLGPAWSPDGTKIAFASEGDIYVMNADGSGQTRLTHVNDFDVSPDWSPDGSKIAFVGGATDTGFIDVMNADGSGRRRLTNGGSDYFPDWSPDGTKIAYHTGRTGNFEIFVMNADGSGQTNLTRTLRSDDFEPAWSPDGTKIAFAGNLDTTAPLLALIARSPQRVLRQKGVIVSVLSNEACTLRALGTISVRGQRSKLRLRPASGRLGAPGQKKTLKLKLSSAGARQLTRLLAQGKRARATFSVRAVDRAGNARTERRTVAVGR